MKLGAIGKSYVPNMHTKFEQKIFTRRGAAPIYVGGNWVARPLKIEHIDV
jgi:hypothetical protein